MNIFQEVLKANNLPEGIVSLINGDYRVGELLTQDTRVALISATGSTRMGKIVGAAVAARLGRSLLELGGNNAIIITPEADLKIVLTGAVFGAVGTAGQRCTTTRRLIIHQSIFDKVTRALVKAYKQIQIGNPLDPKNHMGPLIDIQAVYHYPVSYTHLDVYKRQLYDGKQVHWVLENVDLSSYLGQVIQLRFLLVSDGFVHKDGFYFDNFKVITIKEGSVATTDVDLSLIHI